VRRAWRCPSGGQPWPDSWCDKDRDKGRPFLPRQVAGVGAGSATAIVADPPPALAPSSGDVQRSARRCATRTPRTPSSGAPLHLVQATLGRASVATTVRYLYARPSDGSARYLPLSPAVWVSPVAHAGSAPCRRHLPERGQRQVPGVGRCVAPAQHQAGLQLHMRPARRAGHAGAPGPRRPPRSYARRR
jgi:hypothetical protein